MVEEFLGLPMRPSKPRERGLTHVIDKGLGPRAWEDVLETSGAYIDIVKLGWGTAYVTPNLKRKLEVLKGKPVVIGGTFFEAVYVKDKVDGGSLMTSYLGTRLIEIEGGLVADLLDQDHQAELTYLIGRHIGQLKARHQRLQPIFLAFQHPSSKRRLRPDLNPQNSRQR
jgi:phosphosulfolactate synthase (CoM biosynthesis protein A)